MEVKDFVKKILEKSFFTEKELSVLLEVDQSLISYWKKGERKIGIDKFLLLLDVLGYNRMDYLYNNTEPKIRMCFKARSLTNADDLNRISKLNKLAANLSLMENLLEDEAIKYN